MSELEINQTKLPDPNELYNQGKAELGNLRELTVGQGSTVFYTDKEGSRWGNIKFDDAAAWIKVDGTAQFKTSSGDIILSTGATDGNFINIINTALNTASKTILTDFTFEATDYAGAFKTGNITWDSVTGLVTGGTGGVFNARGLIFASAGVATITLDATTGNATFAGTLSAATGTIGAITLATGGNIKAGKTAYSDDTNAGFWLGLDSGTPKFNIGSSSSKYFHYDGTDFTLTGGIIQTGTTGYNVKIDSSKLTVRTGTTEIGSLWGLTGDVTVLEGKNALYIDAGDGLALTYNNGGGTDGLVIYNDSGIVAYFDDNDDFVMNTGDIQTGGTFKSSDGSSGQSVTSYQFITDIWKDAEQDLNAKYRTLTFKDGILTSISGETTFEVINNVWNG